MEAIVLNCKLQCCIIVTLIKFILGTNIRFVEVGVPLFINIFNDPLQVTMDAAGGLVSSRDFVYLYMIGSEGAAWVMAGQSVDCEDAPSSGSFVRADNGPGLQMVTPCEVGEGELLPFTSTCTIPGCLSLVTCMLKTCNMQR